MFVDTHAHIFMKQFDADREAVVARARDAGVIGILNVGLDVKTNAAVLDFARGRDGVFAVIGHHPHDAETFDADAFEQQVRAHADEIVALGEFGLDFFRDYAPRDVQKHAFAQSLDIGLRAGKPLVIHCRAAESDVMQIMHAASDAFRGVMHCFSGDTDFLKQTLDLGMHISVGGPATYPKSGRLESVLRAVPRDRLLLETDCPYLAPQKFRGKRNEPAYIPIIAERIAEIWNVSSEEAGRITTQNAINLFNLNFAEMQ